MISSISDELGRICTQIRSNYDVEDTGGRFVG